MGLNVCEAWESTFTSVVDFLTIESFSVYG